MCVGQPCKFLGEWEFMMPLLRRAHQLDAAEKHDRMRSWKRGPEAASLPLHHHADCEGEIDAGCVTSTASSDRTDHPD